MPLLVRVVAIQPRDADEINPGSLKRGRLEKLGARLMGFPVG